jgi:hypothetical protein
MTVPSIDATGLDTSDALTKQETGSAPSQNYEADAKAEGERAASDDEYLRLHRAAVEQADRYLGQGTRQAWERSLKAWRNEHFPGSKYLSDAYKGRSKLFVPKTRSAVRKAQTAAAKALFGTGDVVAITPENEADDFQQAAAAVKQELINYRLSRVSNRNGIPWFLIALGARFDSLVTGICASKQQWLYSEKVVRDGSDAVYHEETGALLQDAVDPETKVLIDRPDIVLFPPENVLFDPNCDWTRPAQNSPYVVLRYPMNQGDALELIRANSGSQRSVRIPWRDISEDEIRKAVSSTGPEGTQGVRGARNNGADPQATATGVFAPCWLSETFMRVHGDDVVFWTLNNNILISDPIPVEEAYPEQHGERPVSIGYGSLEPHRVFPMSPVESWQPLQQQVNDSTNLRLDHVKQVVNPPSKVKRGRQIDLKAVQRRGQGGVIQVQDMGDLEWAEIPDVPASSYQEQHLTDAAFDDLAGLFNSSTVQNNRAMNETVGGMRLLSGEANSVSDFDLEVWTETWAEPTLFQIMRAIEYFESDETVLAIAGYRAKLFQKWGMSEITDHMLLAETTLTIKIGVGASNDPQSRLQNFVMASKALQEVMAPMIAAGKVDYKPNPQEIANTVFTSAGFKDGAERFFEFTERDPSQQPNPAAMEAQLKAQELQLKDKKIQTDAALKTQDLAQRGKEAALSFVDAQRQRQADIMKEHMRAEAEIHAHALDAHHDAAMSGRDHAHQRNQFADGIHGELLKHILMPPPEPKAPGGGASAE